MANIKLWLLTCLALPFSSLYSDTMSLRILTDEHSALPFWNQTKIQTNYFASQTIQRKFKLVQFT